MQRFDPTRLLPVLVLAALVAAAPAAAGTFGTTYYTCTVDVVNGTHDCTDGILTVTASSGNQRVLRVDQGSYVRLDAFVESCSPSNWWIHFADSPTCNGYGGDAATTDHDAEAHIRNTRFDAYGTHNYGRGGSNLVYRTASAVPPTGCLQSQWSIYEDRILFDDDPDASDAALIDLSSIYSFESAPYDEPDGEDTNSTDADRWYVGLNRTVGASYRNGSGTDRVCFVVSTTTTPSPTTLNSVCP